MDYLYNGIPHNKEEKERVTAISQQDGLILQNMVPYMQNKKECSVYSPVDITFAKSQN